ncbi:hypothetical protein CNEO3_160032 [Clostridium neonatale]|nr:hypothetical protein CNEO_210080 [Clostridium neonatale]CAI3575034.1 hypothetical protein CNEO3_160032 [Clostridium neonatale]CAI3575626.1 hypothetical protein CNEO4_150090 [Clostridium neonatale]CAI3642097.1 hypothetical protein CNEO3_820001 [Clostridium neonatale]
MPIYSVKVYILRIKRGEATFLLNLVNEIIFHRNSSYAS